MIIVLVFAYLLGMISAGVMFVGYGYYKIRQIKQTKAMLFDQIKAKAKELEDKSSSIKDRLLKASELAKIQMDLRAALEQPSKNSLHSQYKNGLAAELVDVEQRKLDILKTILAEGLDPSIMVINDSGSKEDMPLSQYVANAQSQLDRHNGVPPGSPPASPDHKKVGKFVIYKGGKDDGETTH